MTTSRVVGGKEKIAVVLFNLGGPDSSDAVLPFLINLFSDAAILRMGQPFRWLLAQTIARRRAPVAREIYEQIGGSSPILAETQAQATALDTALAGLGGDLGAFKSFIAMRYWHPRAAAALADVRGFAPDRIVLLPLYPHYSTTTTESSVDECRGLARAADIPTHLIGCYGTQSWFIQAQARIIAPLVDQARAAGAPRVLFSAHGLPKRISDDGDPYAQHTQQTARAVARELGLAADEWSLCYQSRVGRLEWIGPSTDDEIRRAGATKSPIVVVPIAFVSEHSETLVELDIEYRAMADRAGVPSYFRAPTLGVTDGFIQGLAGMVRDAVNGDLGPCASDLERLCPSPMCGRDEEAI
ncbi:MAG: ferrochelatase [Alphaproteobacteria bacterium]|nr:ferrochelatase [Alphaproteobacteria bacterium]